MSRRPVFTLALALLLAACASERWTFSAPPGVSEAQLKFDHQACKDESGIERLREERERIEQQCMMDRGYKMSAVKP